MCVQCNPVTNCGSNRNNTAICNMNSNAGNDQPCPNNKFTYSKEYLGGTIIAERILRVRDAINAEERRRHFSTTSFGSDVYVQALIKSLNLSTLRDALDKMVSRRDYCWCDCNYSCACIKHDNIMCVCNCDYCSCNCDYCTCNCNYGCRCTCNYSDRRLKCDIKYM